MKKNYLIIVGVLFCFSLFGQTPGNGVTDIDGNSYPTVIIGGQEWMAENLRTVHYNNGDLIPNVPDSNQWINLNSGAWSYYNNDSSFDSLYGKLYNWYTVNDARGLCPTGWKIPSDDDFETLVTFLGGTWEAGGKIKESGTSNWNSPNTGATNSSGFTALPSGSREYGTFDDIGNYGYFWSTWDNHPTTRHRWELRYFQTIFAKFSISINNGYSCRCIKDNSLGLNPINKTGISIFPNPIQTDFQIKITPDNLGKQFKIIDNTGKILISGKLSKINNKINLNHFASGIYYLQLKGITLTLIKN